MTVTYCQAKDPFGLGTIRGSSVVFYVDDDDSCNYDFLSGYTIIVQGVKNIISACRECKVKRLIYNSTADVVLDSSLDIHNGNETLLYATKFRNVYSELKAQAEATVLLANDTDGLLTCALRPANIFGPGDKQLLPSLVDVAKSSWAKITSISVAYKVAFKVAVGFSIVIFYLPFYVSVGTIGNMSGSNGSDGSMSDYTYVENVAHALICAEAALGSHMLIVSGKVFFITNLEPVRSWEFFLPMLEGLRYYRPMVKLPAVVVRLIVYLIKWMHSKTNSRNICSSVSVHSIVQLMSQTATYDCSAAEQHIEYSPVVSMNDGVTSTIEASSHLAKDSSSILLDQLYEQSKIQQLLGGGEVAEILLWRDETKSFVCFCGVISLFYWFCLCERTVVSSTALLLLLIVVFLYGYAQLSHEDPQLSSEVSKRSLFEVSEMCMRRCVRNVVNIWNGVSHIFRSLAGGDWSLLFKVVVLIHLFKLLVVNSFPISLGIALAFSFIVFFVYEQYEEEIDGLVGIINELVWQFMASVRSS
ncbi:3-beta hydroxysteroid dehydrogenase/isomerase [Tanacetum coccineum]